VFVADRTFFGGVSTVAVYSWTSTVDLRGLPLFHINKYQLEEEGQL